MLLRSSSSPILKSWLPSNYHTNNSNYSSSSPNNINERTLSLPRTNSFSAFTASSSSPSSPSTPYRDRDHFKLATCTLFETDFRDPAIPQTTTTLQRMFSSSGLDEEVSVSEDGGGGDGGGGVGHGGCGGGFGFNDYSSSNNNNNENGNMEAYYENMIKANPVDPLLLGNYARFLKEVRGNLGKAEEYCERAIILGSPNDGNTLSLYADIIWQLRGDAPRAETYFDLAVEASPNDCYVHASYAKFLWDSEGDDDDDEAGEEDCRHKVRDDPTPSPPHYSEETPRRFPLITT